MDGSAVKLNPYLGFLAFLSTRYPPKNQLTLMEHLPYNLGIFDTGAVTQL